MDLARLKNRELQLFYEERGVAFWADGEEGRPATRTEFAPFPIVPAAFRTAHSTRVALPFDGGEAPTRSADIFGDELTA